MLEDELKFDVAESFALPKVKGLVPRKSKALTATYFDTSDFRLARAGASLRYRVGDEQPWTVKLPTGTPGVRHEISVAAPQGRPPADLVWLVCSLTRGAALRKVAVIASDRRRRGPAQGRGHRERPARVRPRGPARPSLGRAGRRPGHVRRGFLPRD